MLLETQLKDRSSALIRALLTLYFNRKIPEADKQMEAEIHLAEAAEQENLRKHRERLVQQRIEKERDRVKNVRTGTSG